MSRSSQENDRSPSGRNHYLGGNSFITVSRELNSIFSITQM